MLRVEGVGVLLLAVAHGRGRQGRGRQRVGPGEQRAQDAFPVDTGDDRPADADVGEQRVAEAQRDLVVDAGGRGGEDVHPGVGEVLLLGGLDLAGDITLAGPDAADADAVLLGDDDVDRVQVRTPRVLASLTELRRGPVVVLPGRQCELGVALLVGDDEGAGADDAAGVAGGEAFVGHVEGGVRQKSGVEGAGGLREAGLGVGEVEADGVVVEDLAVVVGADLLRGGQLPLLVTLAEEVEITDDVLGGERGAVGVGDTVAQVEGEFGGVPVDLGQVGGDPRVELEGVRVLPEEAVGDVVHHAAVRVVARGRRVEGLEGQGLEVGELMRGGAVAVAAGRQAGDGGEGGDGREGRHCETSAPPAVTVGK